MVDASTQLTFSQENDLLNLLQVTSQELGEALQPDKAGEEKGADRISNGHTIQIHPGFLQGFSIFSGSFVCFTQTECAF